MGSERERDDIEEKFKNNGNQKGFAGKIVEARIGSRGKSMVFELNLYVSKMEETEFVVRNQFGPPKRRQNGTGGEI